MKPTGLSVDSPDRHEDCEADVRRTQGSAVNFPMIADADRTVPDLYGMVHPDADPALTVRTVFITDPDTDRLKRHLVAQLC